MTQLFHSNTEVEFMDVNLSQERIMESESGESYNPGAGGWPTIRYFNKETGLSGGEYQKKTDKSMCDELGNEDAMIEYVEEYGNTSTCDIVTKVGCGERQIGYIDKMKVKSSEEIVQQLERLEKMEGSSMKPDLLAWLKQRKKILSQLVDKVGVEGSEL